MNTLTAKIMLGASLMAAGLLAADVASAHGFRHSRARVGIYFGAPVVVAPWYYSPWPRYYYPPYAPAVVVPAPQPPVYVEQPQSAEAPPPASQADNYWYYCRDTQAYYPYVDRCASPWQRVVPQPPPS